MNRLPCEQNKCIKKGGVMSSGDSSALVGVEVPCLSCIQGEIGTLRDFIKANRAGRSLEEITEINQVL
jgi:hypothetical protein